MSNKSKNIAFHAEIIELQLRNLCSEPENAHWTRRRDLYRKPLKLRKMTLLSRHLGLKTKKNENGIIPCQSVSIFSRILPATSCSISTPNLSIFKLYGIFETVGARCHDPWGLQESLARVLQ